MSTAKIECLPAAVAAFCLSFLDSRDHSRCARLCVSFRRAALLSAGFPASLLVASPPHVAFASPALAQMRPHRLLEIRVGEFLEAGLVGPLLNGQTRVRHIVFANGCPFRDACDAPWAVAVDRAYESPKRDRGPLGACRRLEVHVRPQSWASWFPELLARLPGLTRLDLCEFPAHEWEALCVAAPQLTALRLERRCENERLVGRDGRGLGDDSDFARRLLESLTHLRSLALPYAVVRHGDLLVAADRLESLEARALDSSMLRPRLAGPLMQRLTHLVAAMWIYSAADTLAGMPHVCVGALTFQSVFDFAAAECVVARLDPAAAPVATAGAESCGYADQKRSERGDGWDPTPVAAEVAADDAATLVRVVWRRVNDAVPDRKHFDLVHNAAWAMAELRVDWAGHDFDASVPQEERRGIFARLPLAVVDRRSRPGRLTAALFSPNVTLRL